jgi:thioesterase domain-containing protein
MCPGLIVPLAAMPMTRSGKIDRIALPDTASSELHQQTAVMSPGAAPTTPIEDMVAAIWAEVLGRPNVGRHQDFFEMGGHSLLAARLVSQMSEIFRVKLPVRTIFEAPTVARLSEVIRDRMEQRRQAEPLAPNGLMELNKQGSRPPFIFLHAALEGDGFYCHNLARQLGEDQPMFALPPLGLDGESIPPTIEAMATSRIAEIRRLQPRGPYYLGGFCVSGLVAFEAARQLKAAGEQVNLVVVIETRMHPPHFFNRLANGAAAVAAKLGGLSTERRLEMILRMRPAAHVASRLWQRRGWKAARRVARRLLTFVATGRRAISGATDSLLAQRVEVTDAARAGIAAVNRVAAHAYLAGNYDGAVTCLWAAEEPFLPEIWQMVAPRVRLQTVPGNHNTCITSKVDSLGAELQSALRQAQAGEEAASPAVTSVEDSPRSQATAPEALEIGATGLAKRATSSMVALMPWIMSIPMSVSW